MKTVKQPVDVHWLPRVNWGGRPQYGGVNLSVYPTVNEETEVVFQVEDDRADWLFASLKEGIEEFLKQHACGHVKVVVTHVYWHPCDTNEKYMKRIGSHAIREAFDQHGIELPPSDNG